MPWPRWGSRGGGVRAAHAQTPVVTAALGPDPSTLPTCTTVSIQAKTPPPGPAGAPGVPVCNGIPLLRTVVGPPHTPVPPSKSITTSGVTPATPTVLGFTEYNPIIGVSPADTDAEGIEAYRTVSTVTPPTTPNADYAVVYNTMHIGDNNPNCQGLTPPGCWTEIGWSYYNYDTSQGAPCGSDDWLYAYNQYQQTPGHMVQAWTCIQQVYVNDTIYVQIQRCSDLRGWGFYFWCDYYWNGTSWVTAVQLKLTTSHAVNNGNPDIDYEVYTNETYNGVPDNEFATVSSFTTDPVWLYSASAGGWVEWTASNIPNSTCTCVVQQPGVYCYDITFPSDPADRYFDWNGQNC